MKNNQIIITAILVIVVGVAAFYGGMMYQKSQPRQFSNQPGGGTGGRGGQFGQRNGNGANRPVAGEITSADDKSITIKLQDGSSKIVFFSATTQINKADIGSKSDLKAGERVAIFGQTNSDGSVTAQNIQINPQLRGMSTPSGTPKKLTN